MILAFYPEVVFHPSINLGVRVESLLSGEQNMKM